MLSILIPTYNYPISQLITSLNKVINLIDFDCEILCLEDGSTIHVDDNKKTCNNYKSTFHFISEKNKGSIASRKYLCKKAKYNWLLFLDADVELTSDGFITTYSEYFNDGYDAIYGGCSYQDQKPKDSGILRWTYGKTFEEVKSSIRNKTPYKFLVSANFLIKKSVFISLTSNIADEGYGYDLFLAAKMKTQNIKVLHIDNPVIHKGLDNNHTYLKKIKQAVETSYKLLIEKKIDYSENSLLKTYITFKKFYLTKLIYSIYNWFKAPIEKQLISNKPNMKLLQFYKLGYLCALSFKYK